MSESRLLKARCEKCGCSLQVKTHSSGKVVPCPNCGAQVEASAMVSPREKPTNSANTPTKTRPYVFPCPNCSSAVRVKPGSFGKEANCRGCEQVVRVPPPAESVEAERRANALAEKLGIARQHLAQVAMALGIAIMCSLVFSAAATFFIQRPLASSAGGMAKGMLGMLIGWVIWMGLFAALFCQEFWAINVAFILRAISIVVGASLVFSGPSLVTPEWPSYLGLANTVVVIGFSAWGLDAKSKYNKLWREAEKVGIREPGENID